MADTTHRQEKRRLFKRQQRKRRAEKVAEIKETVDVLKEGVEEYAKRENKMKKEIDVLKDEALLEAKAKEELKKKLTVTHKRLGALSKFISKKGTSVALTDYFRATPTVNVGLKQCLFLKCREIKHSWLSEDPNESVNVGSGSFGVCQAKYLAGERVCVKTFKSQRKEELLNEVDILSSLHHESILWILGGILEKPVGLVSRLYQFCGQPTSLCKAVSASTSSMLSHQQFFTLRCIDVFDGVKYLHDHEILHNDIKADNVVLEGNFTSAVSVIVDFGKAIKSKNARTKRSLSGETLVNFLKYHSHVAPKIPKGGKESFASDVYSLGILLRFMGRKLQKISLQRHGIECCAVSADKRPDVATVRGELRGIVMRK